MDLPRMPSNASLSPPSTQILSDINRPRTPISRKLLSASSQEPQFAVIPSASHFHPSCKREEARALQNLRRRVQALRLVQGNRSEPIEAANNASKTSSSSSYSPLDNRPQLLQKILSTKPVSMVLDISDIQTAWQDSDFITDCLCWHNVYRQRHSSPPLSMSSEALSNIDFEKVRCGNCKGYLNHPPIMTFLHQDGYVECGRCYNLEESIRKGLLSIRNKSLELLASVTPFPCKNFGNGCTERRLWPQIEIHEAECMYRTFKCPVSVLKLCNYEGVAAKLIEHVQEKHPDSFLIHGDLNEKFDKDFENNYLVKQNNGLFVVQAKFNYESDKAWFSVELLEELNEFQYNIQFNGEKANNTLNLKRIATSRPITFLDTDEALAVDIKAVRTILQEPKKLTCTIFLTKTISVLSPEVVLEEMQCPICLEFMDGKIFLCSNGHNVCVHCKTAASVCPTCREHFLDVRNLTLEKVVSGALFPCKNHVAGCRHATILSEITHHFNHCAFSKN